mgnify:CR=1 FL=1
MGVNFPIKMAKQILRTKKVKLPDMEVQNTFKDNFLIVEYMNRFYNPTFIKWAGGKTQLLSQYAKLYPKEFNRYFEPFLGSGAVFFHIKQKFKPKQCFISDINEDLINTFKAVKEQPEELIKLLKEHKAKDNSKEYFNQQRERFNTIKAGLEKAALFIYINKTCFNGLYRVNAEGKFNVPFGKYPNPAILQEEKIRQASKLLQDVNISESNFSDIVREVREGDFIYFDPPYFPLSKTSSFTSYQKGIFLEDEQRELARIFGELHKKGCFVMLSNSDTPFIRQLYEGFNIVTVKARRAINCIGTKRGKINEIVVTNY